MCRGFESHPSSSFFFSEKKEFGLVALPFFLFIGLRVFMEIILNNHMSAKDFSISHERKCVALNNNYFRTIIIYINESYHEVILWHKNYYYN